MFTGGSTTPVLWSTEALMVCMLPRDSSCVLSTPSSGILICRGQLGSEGVAVRHMLTPCWLHLTKMTPAGLCITCPATVPRHCRRRGLTAATRFLVALWRALSQGLTSSLSWACRQSLPHWVHTGGAGRSSREPHILPPARTVAL